jgi:RimJ/RimL family protein N-acetyltransferase
MGPYVHNDEYFWKGSKTRLRPLCLSDLEYLYTRTLDSFSRQNLILKMEMPITLEAIKERIEKHAKCQSVSGLVLFLIENHSQDRVGILSWHSCDEKNGTFSFGISIDKESQRCGYAFDAVLTLLRFAFWEKRYHKCHTSCLKKNSMMIALNRKLGLREEGTRKEQWFIDGNFVDDIIWGMTRDEFDVVMQNLHSDGTRLQLQG